MQVADSLRLHPELPGQLGVHLVGRGWPRRPVPPPWKHCPPRLPGGDARSPTTEGREKGGLSLQHKTGRETLKGSPSITCLLYTSDAADDYLEV